MAETNKKAKQSQQWFSQLNRLHIAIIALAIVLGASLYLQLQPTGMVVNNIGDETGNGAGNGAVDVFGLEGRELIESPYETFEAVSGDICEEDGKPLVILFSSTRCQHCVWIKDTFDSVAQEYSENGHIVAYHWQLDTGNDELTEAPELGVPAEYQQLFEKFSVQQYTPGYVPTFVFGCKYYRVGTYYEGKWSAGELTEAEALQNEEAEFREIIEDMLNA